MYINYNVHQLKHNKANAKLHFGTHSLMPKNLMEIYVIPIILLLVTEINDFY